MGLLGAMGRISAAAAQFSNASMQNNVKLLLLVTAGALFIGTGSAICVTETAGHALPDDDPELENVEEENDVEKRAGARTGWADTKGMSQNPMIVDPATSAEAAGSSTGNHSKKRTPAATAAPNKVQESKQKKGEHSRRDEEEDNDMDM